MKSGMGMTVRRYRLLVLLTCIGMFLVLIAGVLVTNTDSGRGCGTDWPLCNGKFIPAYTVESMVEYSHRMISGIVGLLVGAAFLATRFWKPARRREPMLYAGGALIFTVMQAILGAMAVVWEQSSLVLALHFGISLFAFTCTWLLYTYVRNAANTGMLPASATPKRAGGSPSGSSAKTGASEIAGAGDSAGSLGLKGMPGAMSEVAPVPPGLMGKPGGTPEVAAVPAGATRLLAQLYRAALALLVYCYVVIYLGAYIRHTSSGGGCVGWPLCNGDLVPELSGSTGVAFAHRTAALLMLVFTALICVYTRKLAAGFPELVRTSTAALYLVGLQVLSGGLLSVTLSNEDVYIFTGLLHTIIISALFSVLCLFAIRIVQLKRLPALKSSD